MKPEQAETSGKLGKFVESVDVEKVLPIATAQEKRMRFAWDTPPSAHFLMTWNQFMEPNSMFVEDVDDQGLTVTVRWGLMKKSPEDIMARLNRWLAEVQQGNYRHSGQPGKHL